jgi:hypothetical protein
MYVHADDEKEIDHQFLQHNLTPATATFTGLSNERRAMRKKG